MKPWTTPMRQRFRSSRARKTKRKVLGQTARWPRRGQQTCRPPPPDMVVTPVIPYPTRDMTKRPIITERLPAPVAVQRMENPPAELCETDSTAGNSTKPATGNYLYLPDIDRYYILPDDVEFDRMIQFGTCVPLAPETRCPVFPLLFYQRGEARIAIDQVGEVFEDIVFEHIEGGDASGVSVLYGKGRPKGRSMSRRPPKKSEI